jgi:hypothetical protein
MSQNARLLLAIKSKQFMLISKAGMAVPSFEMSSDKIHDNMLIQYKYHVESYKLPPNLSSMPKERLFRTNKHLAKDVTNKDMHSGVSLWRKYGQIKKYVLNSITPIYMKNLGPDGQLPSGCNKENVLFITRQHLFEAEQLVSKGKSKTPANYKMKPFDINWYPAEWEVFINFGGASEKPERSFFIE